MLSVCSALLGAVVIHGWYFERGLSGSSCLSVCGWCAVCQAAGLSCLAGWLSSGTVFAGWVLSCPSIRVHR